MKLRLLAAGAALMLTLSACGGSDSGSSIPNAAPTDKVSDEIDLALSIAGAAAK